jgi:hypothetical protein
MKSKLKFFKSMCIVVLSFALAFVCELAIYSGVEKRAMEQYVTDMSSNYGEIWATYYNKSYWGEPCIVFCQKNSDGECIADSLDADRLRGNDYRKVETPQAAEAINAITKTKSFTMALMAITFLLFIWFCCKISIEHKA